MAKIEFIKHRSIYVHLPSLEVVEDGKSRTRKTSSNSIGVSEIPLPLVLLV